MCLRMTDIVQSQVAGTDNLRNRLAVAVRSVQWSYVIFWSQSTTQRGVLEWVDGYYNGDIKTRKTANGMELKGDTLELERSVQLRELYKSLLEGETDQHAKRHSVALSPEDLTDTEWYYLICMSFVFNPGQGLPGRVLAERQTIWLCNAQNADSNLFFRSLLAKSASIQTVVSFPHLEGVMELGTTELVTEDPGLIQHFKASLLAISKPVCSEKSSSAHHNADDNKDPICPKVSHETVDTLHLEDLYSPPENRGISKINGNMHEGLSLDHADNCSNSCGCNHQTEHSCMLEVLCGGASQVQSWHFMDDEFSNSVQDSVNSIDCISEAVVNRRKAISTSDGKNIIHVQLKELQESNHTKLSSLDLGADDDLHYKRTVSVVLRSSNQFLENLFSPNSNYNSSFISCKEGVNGGHRPQEQQNILKKILFAVPSMHDGSSLKSDRGNKGKDFLRELKRAAVGKMHFLDKQKENEKFCTPRSREVPSISEIDKSSVISVTINYVKELKARIEELQSCVGSVDYETRSRRNNLEMAKQTSDHRDKEIDNSTKSWVNKRKAYNIDEADPELNEVAPINGLTLDVKVSMKQKELLIEIRCPYREYILLDIMDEINKLQLDVLSVQSSTLDGNLILILKTKFRRAPVVQEEIIRQALWNIAFRS